MSSKERGEITFSTLKYMLFFKGEKNVSLGEREMEREYQEGIPCLK